MLFDVCCLMFVALELLLFVCCLLLCILLYVALKLLVAVCCLLFGGDLTCCVLVWFVVWCVECGVFALVVCCVSSSCVACCLLQVECHV